MSAPKPKSWTELCDLLGEPSARRLVELHGGEEIAIPRRCHHDHPLSAGLGIETYRTLVSMWGGCRVYIPVVIRRQMRDAEIRRRRGQGETIQQIARAVGLSERHVRGRIRKTIP